MVVSPYSVSAGFEALLGVRDQCGNLGGSIVLARPNALCRDILRINEVDRELNVFEDIGHAMGSFAK